VSVLEVIAELAVTHLMASMDATRASAAWRKEHK